VFGTQITVVADLKQIAAAVVDCRPTIWGAVPRIWEKLKQAIEHTPPPSRIRPAGRHGAGVGGRGGAGRADPRRGAHPRRARGALGAADKVVLSGLRDMLGFSELRWAVSGAAPIPAATLAFFAGVGIPITEIWGMSELSCICSVSAPDDARLGTVGKLLPGMEYQIAEDGEFLSGAAGDEGLPQGTGEDRRGHRFRRLAAHRGRGERRRRRLPADRRPQEGTDHQRIRQEPLPGEHRERPEGGEPLVGTAVAIGDSRAFITALLVLDAEAAAGYAARRGIDPDPRSLAKDPELVATLQAGVAEGNTKLARVEQIKRFRVLPTFWEPGGDEMTPTMKLKRKPIAGKYAAEIDGLYASPAGRGPRTREPVRPRRRGAPAPVLSRRG